MMAARGDCEKNGSAAADPNCKTAMRTYPWGEAPPTCTNTIWDDGKGCGTDGTWAVGSTPAGDSPYGLHDMAGNVWEWNWDRYGDYSDGDQSDPVSPGSGYFGTARGGSFDVWDAQYLRVSGLFLYFPGASRDELGFRCAGAYAVTDLCTGASCDDGNACTPDSCQPASGCQHGNVSADSACGDGGSCDGKGSCAPAPAGMVLIPAGGFEMGCVPGDSACGQDEKPRHPVMLDAFYMDVYEVTVAKYKACVDAGLCTLPDSLATNCTWGWSGKAQNPVNCVTWTQADAYCKWTDAYGHLPTEAQWEKAARGGLEGKFFPWGDDFDCSQAVWDKWSGGCDGDWPEPVGSKPLGKNGYGLYDMAGNVWEWVSDWYDADYYGKSPGTNPGGPANGLFRIVRGGGVGTYATVLTRVSARLIFNPFDAREFIGFRCARSYP